MDFIKYQKIFVEIDNLSDISIFSYCDKINDILYMNEVLNKDFTDCLRFEFNIYHLLPNNIKYNNSLRKYFYHNMWCGYTINQFNKVKNKDLLDGIKKMDNEELIKDYLMFRIQNSKNTFIKCLLMDVYLDKFISDKNEKKEIKKEVIFLYLQLLNEIIDNQLYKYNKNIITIERFLDRFIELSYKSQYKKETINIVNKILDTINEETWIIRYIRYDLVINSFKETNSNALKEVYEQFQLDLLNKIIEKYNKKQFNDLSQVLEDFINENYFVDIDLYIKETLSNILEKEFEKENNIDSKINKMHKILKYYLLTIEYYKKPKNEIKIKEIENKIDNIILLLQNLKFQEDINKYFNMADLLNVDIFEISSKYIPLNRFIPKTINPESIIIYCLNKTFDIFKINYNILSINNKYTSFNDMVKSNGIWREKGFNCYNTISKKDDDTMMALILTMLDFNFYIKYLIKENFITIKNIEDIIDKNILKNEKWLILDIIKEYFNNNTKHFLNYSICNFEHMFRMILYSYNKPIFNVENEIISDINKDKSENEQTFVNFKYKLLTELLYTLKNIKGINKELIDLFSFILNREKGLNTRNDFGHGGFTNYTLVVEGSLIFILLNIITDNYIS